MNTIEEGVFLRNTDSQHPNRFVLVGRVSPSGVTRECFVHVTAESLGSGEKGPVYEAVGRTAHISIEVLQRTTHWVPVAKPFVLRRHDGHEVAVG